ncbi:MAG: phage tail protein [bacterium]|nr:phage tail protein [bacterium]
MAVPEYLAPGVYVEETSFRAKSIEGVSTSTTAFAGPARKGPIGETPELLTSLGDFSRIYGGLSDLSFGTSFGTNYLAHAVNAYFNNGGSRLYVSRVFSGDPEAGKPTPELVVDGGSSAEQAHFVARFPGSAANGRIELSQAGTPVTQTTMDSAPLGSLVAVAPALPARVTGSQAGPFSVPDGGTLYLTVKTPTTSTPQITFLGQPAKATAQDPLEPLTAAKDLKVTIGGDDQQTLTVDAAAGSSVAGIVDALNRQLRGGYATLDVAGKLEIGTDVRGASASVTVAKKGAFGFTIKTTASNSLDADNNVDDLANVTAGEIDSLLQTATPDARAESDASGRLVLRTTLANGDQEIEVGDGADSVHAQLGFSVGASGTGSDGATDPYYLKYDDGWRNSSGQSFPDGAAELLTANVIFEDADGSAKLFEDLGFDRAHPRWMGHVLALEPAHRADALENLYALEIGDDVDGLELREGLFSTESDRTIAFTGGNDGAGEPGTADYEAALEELERLQDVSIVAAPGSSAYGDAQGIAGALISHAERRRACRIAVVDTPPGLVLSEAREVRGNIDSTYAALYYPWVVVSNPLARPGDESIPRELTLPPSSFVCGIYARNDVERGVHKAPANEVVRGALRFETEISFAQQEALNPIGVNCLRSFPGRGHRVWGTRTASSDPEWKYVNLRRYFLYLEQSIDRSTQWVVFEPNGERLWANVRETVDGFLYNEWVSGALLGGSPQEAYFVRCDRSTMTQNDLDNGRLICLIGVAPLRPAEFVIFRIGQKTADARG